MPLLLCYTKQGPDHYREVNDAMHLALGDRDGAFQPLRNNTAVLFPSADFSEGGLPGCTKTMLDPWLFRFADGAGGVLAVRRNQNNQPDSKHRGSVMIYRTTDFVHYQLQGFLKLEEEEVRSPRCRYDALKDRYLLEWQSQNGIQIGYTNDWVTLNHRAPGVFSMTGADGVTVPHAVGGNCIDLSEEEAAYLLRMFGEVYHVSTTVPELTLQAGTRPQSFPKATCHYSDGSIHEKKVCWDSEALQALDLSHPGVYTLSGELVQKVYPVPFITHASDPCVFHYRGKYYFTSSDQTVCLRESDTVDGLREVPKTHLYQVPGSCFWAQEIHLIQEVPYIFTSFCADNDWRTVQSIILRCDGEIGNPADWSAPHYVVKKNGSRLMETGISLDMTYFELDGTHYVSWSNREMNPNGDACNEGGSNGTADIYIATIDPKTPWQLTSDPVCICRPDFGWDRLETEVDEGPYLLRHGDDLFLTFSGASVGTVYCLGLLHAKCGSDLLDPASWIKVPYPLLTKESVPGQYGPGHNNFFQDPDNPQDDLMAVLYRPYAEWYEATYDAGTVNPRHSAIRRVHWNANGYPNLEMAPERDINPALKSVSLTIRVV